MSVVQQAFRGGVWLASFTAISQIVSWSITLIIARLLVPADYALMDMATILTGYVFIFNELGLGSAIIQRKEVNHQELSSVFWVAVIWGLLLGAFCFALAYPTVWIFDEPQIFNLTQAVAIIFVLSATYIVPRNLLYRDLRYKAVGAVEALAVTVSSLLMVVFAMTGFGVWTLLLGHIIREFVKCLGFMIASGFRPQATLSLPSASPYIRFGLPVIGAGSVRYAYFKADIFFGGRALAPASLGQFSLALRLAEIPNNKIVSLLSNVAYPVFSRQQDTPEQFSSSFLRMTTLLSLITFPIFVGAIFVAGDLIPLVLGEQWTPCIVPFQLLCIGEIFGTLNAVSHVANMARGKPGWRLALDLVSFPIMTISFWYAATYKSATILAVPWAALFPILQSVYLVKTAIAISVSPGQLLAAMRHPLFGVIFMTLLLAVVDALFPSGDASSLTRVPMFTLVGFISFTCYIFVAERTLLTRFWEILRRRGG